MTGPHTLTCRSCRRGRTLDELLVVEDLATGRRFHVCRPELSIVCFARVRGRDHERIALAAPPALTRAGAAR